MTWRCDCGQRWEAAAENSVCPECGRPGRRLVGEHTRPLPTLTPVVVNQSDLVTVSEDQARVPDDPEIDVGPGYRILGVLGRGGMGVVYRARDERLGREVALKVLRGFSESAEARLRFQREAEVLARLRHPGIVQVFEAGQLPGGQPYFTMELVEGGSLARLLNGNPLPPEVAAEVVRTIALALNHAHEAGVLHRDLKPGNILLSTEGTHSPVRVAKVSDFGLAVREDDQRLTREGFTVGTPAYMAPEQVTNRPEGRLAGVDLWGLGTILYECLTGRPPFLGSTTLETLEMVRSQDPIAPRRLRPNVPRDLETICLKCLEKDPRRRYSSAAALADDLGRFLEGQPVQARPTPAWERAWKWARRRPAAAGLLLVSLLSLVVLVAGGWWSARQLARERDRAEEGLELALAAAEEVLAELLTQEQLNLEAAARAGLPQPPLVADRQQRIERALAHLERMVALAPAGPRQQLRTALTLKPRADALRVLGRQQDALSAYDEACQRLAPLLAGEPDNSPRRRILADCHRHRADLLRAVGRLEEAESAYRQALESAAPVARASASGVVEEARVRIQHGMLLHERGRRPEARAALETAVATLTNLPGGAAETAEARRLQAKALLNLGMVLRQLGQPRQAEQVYQQAIEGLTLLTVENPHRPETRHELGVTLLNLGYLLMFEPEVRDLGRAASGLRRALAVLGSLSDDFPRHPIFRKDWASVLLNLGIVLAWTGDFDGAAAVWTEARARLKLLVQQYPAIHEYRGLLAIVTGNLGWLRLQDRTWPMRRLAAVWGNPQGGWLIPPGPGPDAASAREHLTEAIEETQAALAQSPQHPVFTTALADQHKYLAEAHLLLGDPERAAASARELAESRGLARDWLAAAFILARCAGLAGQGQAAENHARLALDYLRRVKAERSEMVDWDSPHLNALKGRLDFQSLRPGGR